MGERHALTVEAAAGGVRLDVWLAQVLPAISRSRVQALIASGHVLVDGQSARPSLRLHLDQRVEVQLPDPEPAVPCSEEIPLDVLYEDEQLAVVDKPAGLVVHPGAGAKSGTLVNALLFRLTNLSGIGGVLRPGIVHRLDKGTSGLLVVAKDDETHRSLVLQFASRTVEKVYLALVVGVPRLAQGRIELPIGRDPRHRQRMAVNVARARSARSDYSVEERFAGASLIRVRIHSGRTHQIRVHLASLGHPVLGDTVYGGARRSAVHTGLLATVVARLDRPALHAARLSFRHPKSGQQLEFESPLPADLRAALDDLRTGARDRAMIDS